MNLRQWYADAFAQDTWRVTPHTTLDVGLRYEYMCAAGRHLDRTGATCLQQDGKLLAFIGGQNGMPRGLMYPNKLRFAPRLGVAHHFDKTGLVFRAAYGIFYTPVDMNTWCNQLHNAPLVFPDHAAERQLHARASTASTFRSRCWAQTVVSFTAFDPHPPAQYIQQWSASVEKSLGRDTTLEVGYHGERGFHLQRSHLINNARPARARFSRAVLIQRRDVPARHGLPAERHGRQHVHSRSARSTCWRTPRGAGTTPATSTSGGAIRTA